MKLPARLMKKSLRVRIEIMSETTNYLKGLKHGAVIYSQDEYIEDMVNELMYMGENSIHKMGSRIVVHAWDLMPNKYIDIKDILIDGKIKGIYKNGYQLKRIQSNKPKIGGVYLIDDKIIYITEHSGAGYGRVGGSYYWKEVNRDGSFGPKEQGGYPPFKDGIVCNELKCEVITDEKINFNNR